MESLKSRNFVNCILMKVKFYVKIARVSTYDSLMYIMFPGLLNISNLRSLNGSYHRCGYNISG